MRLGIDFRELRVHRSVRVRTQYSDTEKTQRETERDRERHRETQRGAERRRERHLRKLRAELRAQRGVLVLELLHAVDLSIV